jgi:hypothetical protein
MYMYILNMYVTKASVFIFISLMVISSSYHNHNGYPITESMLESISVAFEYGMDMFVNSLPVSVSVVHGRT